MKDAEDGVTADDDLNEETSKLDLDSILVEIGQSGWYQRRTLALVALVALLGGYSSNEFVFTASRIRTRCEVPQCEDGTATFTANWLPFAIPGANGTYDNCQQFNRSSMHSTCSPDSFDHDSIIPCDQYVYKNTDTIVYEFGLACEEWRRSLIGSASTFGMMLALPLTGWVADRRGRRFALALSAFNRAWLGLARYFSHSYASFVTLEFLEALCSGATFSCAYTIAMELVGPQYRVAAGAKTSTFFALGMIMQALMAWVFPYWRHLTLALYIPQLLMVSYFWIMPESVRWYMSKGRYTESEKVLKQAALLNGKVLSEKSLQGLRLNSEEEIKKKELAKEHKVKEPSLVTLVFQHKPILLRCLVTPVWWITTTLVYYGLSMNAVNMSGNKYLNYAAVAAVEVPGYWTAVLLLDRLGRKPLLFVAFWICAACQIGFILIPDDGYFGLSLAVYLIGKYCISIVVTSIYIYTNELYPTQHRTSLFAFSSMIGRIGSITAPLTPALGSLVWGPLPFVLFAALAAASGLLVLLAPETRGLPLPDTMHQAACLAHTISPSLPARENNVTE